VRCDKYSTGEYLCENVVVGWPRFDALCGWGEGGEATASQKSLVRGAGFPHRQHRELVYIDIIHGVTLVPI